MGTPPFLTVSTPFQTQMHSIVASPEIAPPRDACGALPPCTSFHSSHKPLISLSICTGTISCEVGTLAFLPFSTPFQTQVQSIMASPVIAPPRAGSRRLPLDTSFHSSHKSSISLSICTGSSSCKMGIPTFLTISTPFQTQVHPIVASPGIAPTRTGCPWLPSGTSFHSSYKPSISLSICTGTSSCEVGNPPTPFLPFQLHSRHKSIP